jgi:transcriptional regulator with XRE-family HTH domain
VPGLRSEEVAELAEVSTGWYEQFESGTSRRVFSVDFVRRIATALRLDADAQATLFRLALPEVAGASQIFEARARDVAERCIARTRDFVRRTAEVSSFEEAVRALVDVAQAILGPSCTTVASIENDSGPPRVFTAGLRARLAEPVLSRRLRDMKAAVRSDAVVLRVDAPDLHNRRLLQRSELVIGLFESRTRRGVMSCSWAEARANVPIEVATIETLVTVISLCA